MDPKIDLEGHKQIFFRKRNRLELNTKENTRVPCTYQVSYSLGKFLFLIYTFINVSGHNIKCFLIMAVVRNVYKLLVTRISA